MRVAHEKERDWLDLIVVSAEARGAGLGTEVMEVLVSQAHARGVPLWLSVYRTNPARRLYRRLGFAERDWDDIRVWMWSVVPEVEATF